MKKFILGALLVTSFPTFAVIGLKDCKSLMGEYTCKVNGETLDLSLKKTGTNTLKISIGDDNSGNSDVFIVDGIARKSTTDDTIVQGTCREDGSKIEILSMFKGATESMSVSIVDQKTVKYSIVKADSAFSFNCSKK